MKHCKMTTTVKVLEVVGVMNRGGAEVMLTNIIRESHNNRPIHYGLAVNLRSSETSTKGTFDDELLSLGCELFPIASQGSIGPVEYVRRFKKIVRDYNPDLVHIHLNAKSGVIAMAARMAGVKRIIVHCHANIRFKGSLLSRCLRKTEMFFQKILIGLYATDYWGCSDEANRRLYWPWLYKHAVVINNAIDVGRYIDSDKALSVRIRESYALPEGAIVLGNVGRIVSQKNIAFIIEIIGELKRRGKYAVLVVAGRQDEQEYVAGFMARARDLGVERQIILLGERGDIPEVMASFDVYIGTSLQEGFGLVAVEAQAAGTPCVLYKGFPRSVDMGLGMVSFHDDFDVAGWCDDIVESTDRAHSISGQKIADQIRQRGFDAKNNAETVCRLYTE